MPAVLQVSPAVDYKLLPITIDADLRPCIRTALAVPSPRVLLVGRNTSWGAPLQSSLEQFGCELSFAPTLRVTSEYVRKGAYTLILLDSTVPPGQRKQLMSALVGSNTSIFHVFPVENGCWWLPALLSGEDCFGSPGYRTKEFTAELEHILRGAL